MYNEVMSEKMFVQLVTAWNHHKCFEYFHDLYVFGFRGNPNPLFRIWRIFKHTCIDGRYKEIEKKGRI